MIFAILLLTKVTTYEVDTMPTKLDHKLTALLASIIEHLRSSADEKLKEFVEKYDKLLDED